VTAGRDAMVSDGVCSRVERVTHTAHRVRMMPSSGRGISKASRRGSHLLKLSYLHEPALKCESEKVGIIARQKGKSL
jgi:hypothetical protein